MAAATGAFHSAAVGEDGSLFVWGRGEYGQLGTGDTDDRLAPTRVAGLPAPVRQVAAGASNTAIVTEAGDLLMCGEGAYGVLGLGDEDDRTMPTLVARAVFDGDAVLMVACGSWYAAARAEGGVSIHTFGRVASAGRQLGHADSDDTGWSRRVCSGAGVSPATTACQLAGPQTRAKP